LFIIGCCTGLRYSDYSRLNKTHFIENGQFIKIKTQKTGAVVQVPVHKFVSEIVAKYNGELPKAKCIQYFDRTIKLICKKVGFNETILYERTIGHNVISKELSKWQVISSHTARRSFATNAFLDGVPTYRIMMITGHRSEKSFFKYIKVSIEDNANFLSNHRFFKM